jgi:hypothetical protein
MKLFSADEKIFLQKLKKNKFCPQKLAQKSNPKRWEFFFSLQPSLPKTAQNFIFVL